MEKGQITDRYSKAVDMLGNPTPEICIGGIYALGHIMRDSPAYTDAIVDVLSAFVRRKAKRNPDLSPPWPAAEAERDEIKPSFPIQAALTVLAEERPTSIAPDLRDSDLRGARLRNAQLQNATWNHPPDVRDSQSLRSMPIPAAIREIHDQSMTLTGLVPGWRHAR